MSTFSNPIVRIEALRPNTNSDTLDIWDGPQGPCQVKRGHINVGDLAAFIPAETMVPVDRPEFAMFAKQAKERGPYVGMARIRGVKLRGSLSVGLVLPAPAGLELGMDASEHFGTKKYVPPPEKNDRKLLDVPMPPGLGAYDIENLWRFQSQDNGDLVNRDTVYLLTEKIHGCNWKWMRRNGVEYVGSRTFWHKPDLVGQAREYWVNTAKKYAEPLAKVPSEFVVFGEVYGPTQDLHYGVDGQDARLAVFDVWSIAEARWLNYNERDALCKEAGLPTVPVLRKVQGTFAQAIQEARDLAQGKSWLDEATVREGIVVRPENEMSVELRDKKPDGSVIVTQQRLIAKVISPEYLSRKDAPDEVGE